MVNTTPQTESSSVQAQITYGKPPPDGEKSYNYIYELPKGQTKRTNFETEDYTLPITDLRQVEPFDLTRNGFQLEKLQDPHEVDWDNDENVSVHSVVVIASGSGLYREPPANDCSTFQLCTLLHTYTDSIFWMLWHSSTGCQCYCGYCLHSSDIWDD